MQNTETNDSYILHNIVEITVHKDVDPHLKAYAKARLSTFINNSAERAETPLKTIEIRPYEVNMPAAHEEEVVAPDSRLRSGYYIHNETEKLAVEKTDTGFTVYTSAFAPIELLLQHMFLEAGYSFMHTASITTSEHQSLLFSGFGGIGKTQIVGTYAQNGYGTQGDDLVFVNKNGTTLSYPKPLMLKDQHAYLFPDLFKRFNEKRSRDKRLNTLKKLLKENLPFMGVYKTYLGGSQKSTVLRQIIHTDPTHVRPTLPAEIPNMRIVPTATANTCYLIKRVKNDEYKTDTLTPEAFAEQMFAIMCREWKKYLWVISWLGTAEIISSSKFFHDTHYTLQEFARHCLVISVHIPISYTPEQFTETIDSLIKNA